MTKSELKKRAQEIAFKHYKKAFPNYAKKLGTSGVSDTADWVIKAIIEALQDSRKG